MYGILLTCIEHYIKVDNPDPTVWTRILEVAGLSQHEYCTHVMYPDFHMTRLAAAHSHVLHEQFPTTDHSMTYFGQCFVKFCEGCGHAMILKVAGRHYRDFLHGIDNLHEMMRFTYPSMQSPYFLVQQEDPHGCVLLYRSARRGFAHYVKGQLQHCAASLYNVHVQVTVLHQEDTEHGCCVQYRLDFNNDSYKPPSLPPPSLSSSTLPQPCLSSSSTSAAVGGGGFLDQLKAVPGHKLFQLFPFSVVFDKDLVIHRVGPGVIKLLGHKCQPGMLISSIFTLRRPLVAFNWSNILRMQNVAFELEVEVDVQDKNHTSPAENTSAYNTSTRNTSAENSSPAHNTSAENPSSPHNTPEETPSSPAHNTSEETPSSPAHNTSAENSSPAHNTSEDNPSSPHNTFSENCSPAHSTSPGENSSPAQNISSGQSRPEHGSSGQNCGQKASPTQGNCAQSNSRQSTSDSNGCPVQSSSLRQSNAEQSTSERNRSFESKSSEQNSVEQSTSPTQRSAGQSTSPTQRSFGQSPCTQNSLVESCSSEQSSCPGSHSSEQNSSLHGDALQTIIPKRSSIPHPTPSSLQRSKAACMDIPARPPSHPSPARAAPAMMCLFSGWGKCLGLVGSSPDEADTGPEFKFPQERARPAESKGAEGASTGASCLRGVGLDPSERMVGQDKGQGHLVSQVTAAHDPREATSQNHDTSPASPGHRAGASAGATPVKGPEGKTDGKRKEEEGKKRKEEEEDDDRPGSQKALLKGQMKHIPEWGMVAYFFTPHISGLEELSKLRMYLADLNLYDSSRDVVLKGFHSAPRLAYHMDQERKTSYKIQKSYELQSREFAMRDNFLRSMLPETVVDKMRRKENTCQTFEMVTILFSKLVGFEQIVSRVNAQTVVQVVNHSLSVFDPIVDKHGLFKVETLGDANYMVAGGVLGGEEEGNSGGGRKENVKGRGGEGENEGGEQGGQRMSHVERMAALALEFQSAAHLVKSPIDRKGLTLRIGIHVGNVVSGTIGTIKPQYCLFGDTVNTASRIQTSGLPGRIHISEPYMKRLDNTQFITVYRGVVPLKGKGNMDSYWLAGRKGDDSTQTNTLLYLRERASHEDTLTNRGGGTHL